MTDEPKPKKNKSKAAKIAAAVAKGVSLAYYTTNDACHRASLSESLLRDIRSLGFGPKETGLGRLVRFPVQEFEAWRVEFEMPETRDTIAKALKQLREQRKQKREEKKRDLRSGPQPPPHAPA